MAPDVVEEIIEELWTPDHRGTDSAVLEEVGPPDLPAPDPAPDAPAPGPDTAPDMGDAGYVTCGTKGDGGSSGCAAGPTAVAPWWLLAFAALGLRRVRG